MVVRFEFATRGLEEDVQLGIYASQIGFCPFNRTVPVLAYRTQTKKASFLIFFVIQLGYVLDKAAKSKFLQIVWELFNRSLMGTDHFPINKTSSAIVQTKHMNDQPNLK